MVPATGEPKNVAEGEVAPLRRELGVEDDLHQHVAELLAHVRQIEAVDRVE